MWTGRPQKSPPAADSTNGRGGASRTLASVQPHSLRRSTRNSLRRSMCPLFLFTMASLVVLERHFWVNLTEIKDTDRIYLDPLSTHQACSPPRWTASQNATSRPRSHRRLCVTSCLKEPAPPLPPVVPRRPRQPSSDPGQSQRPSSPSRKSSNVSAQPNATHI